MQYSFGTRLTKLLSFCYDALEDEEKDATIITADDNIDNGDDPTTATNTIANNKRKTKTRNYTIDEVCGNVTISTKNNRNLERLWCVSSKRTTSLTITKGKNGFFFRIFWI
jgi:hypothetical protein